MWIENTDPETHPLRALCSTELTDGETIEFTENWKANVPQEIGESLVEQTDFIVPVENSDDETTDSE